MLQLAPCLLGALYTADGGSKLAVQPVRLVRLLNSVYGSEHLLLFGREEECLYAHSSQSTHPQLASTHSARTVNPQRAHTPRSTLLAGPSPRRPDQLMSTLLAFDQAAALEAELGGSGSAQSRGMFGDLGLTGKLLARTDFFEAVARQSYGPWELAQRARRAEGVADAMVQHLAERRSPVESSTCLGATAVALRYVARHRAIAGVAFPRPLSMAGRHLPGAPACLVPWPSGVE